MRCLNPRSVKVFPRLDSSNNGLRAGYSRALVPCGHCVACMRNKMDDLSLRLSFEFDDWFQVLFVTYTYDAEHTDMSLHKKDAQFIIKTLRNRFNSAYGETINERFFPFHWKYFLTGEYGEKRDRPHYHLLLYLPRKVDWHIIHDASPFGVIVDIDVVHSIGVCYYVAKYTLKEVCLEYDWGTREKPFYLQSNGMGLAFVGSKEFAKLKRFKDYRFRDAGGFIHQLPRYLRDKTFNVYERYDILDRISDEQEKNRPKNFEQVRLANLRFDNEACNQSKYLKKFKQDLQSTLL